MVRREIQIKAPNLRGFDSREDRHGLRFAPSGLRDRAVIRPGRGWAALCRRATDATPCDRALADSRDRLTEWLRTAIAKGVIGGPWEGEFPRYAWYKTGSTVYEARLVNRAQGTYKGYGLLPDEWPKDIETHYELIVLRSRMGAGGRQPRR